MTTPLITRLEKAAEGSRELNIALGQVLGLIDEDLIYTNPDGKRSRFGNCDPWPNWTGSIDRAAALAERVLPRWEWLLRTDEERGFMVNCWRKGDEPNMGDECFPSYAATPALAFCLAILKANHKDKP